MNPESFHFLYDVASRDPLAVVGAVVGVPIMLAVLFVGTLRRIHPVVLWLLFTAAGFGFSQVFPENRNQKPSLLIGGAIGSAILVGWWSWRIAPGIRKKFRVPDSREFPLERRL
jgi:hypothetical protein